METSREFFNAKNLLERMPLAQFLQELHGLQGPLAGPAKPPELIKFNTSQTIGEALKTLAAYNILSAPVSDALTGEYTGMVDAPSILRSLLKGVYAELLEKDFVASHQRLSISELQSVGVEFCSRRLSSVLHGGDLWYKGDAESNLLEIVESGFRVSPIRKTQTPSQHLRVHHRVAVFDILPGEQTPDGPVPEWRITDIVSQTDVIRFLAAHVDRLDRAFDKSVSELGMVQGAAEVATVSAGTPVLAAFALMQRRGLSGVGVTAAEGGPLISNLSSSDMRGLTGDRFGALALPVGSYLCLMRLGGLSWDSVITEQTPSAIKEGRWAEVLQPLPVLSCRPSSTLKEVIRQLVDHNRHRVYVVDDSDRAVGVVTPTDVLRLITS